MTINPDELRKIAEAATPGPWGLWNPAVGESHIAIANKVAWRSVVSATGFVDDEFIPHWADANHIATFNPETVLALLSRLEQAEEDRVKLRNRLDAMRRQRDGYQNQIRKTEQQVSRVREFSDQLRGYCSPYGVAHDYAKQLDRALDGEQA